VIDCHEGMWIPEMKMRMKILEAISEHCEVSVQVPAIGSHSTRESSSCPIHGDLSPIQKRILLGSMRVLISNVPAM
jgi:hypothetical protein